MVGKVNFFQERGKNTQKTIFLCQSFLKTQWNLPWVYVSQRNIKRGAFCVWRLQSVWKICLFLMKAVFFNGWVRSYELPLIYILYWKSPTHWASITYNFKRGNGRTKKSPIKVRAFKGILFPKQTINLVLKNLISIWIAWSNKVRPGFLFANAHLQLLFLIFLPRSKGSLLAAFPLVLVKDNPQRVAKVWLMLFYKCSWNAVFFLIKHIKR